MSRNLSTEERLLNSPAFAGVDPVRIMDVAAFEQSIIEGDWMIEQLVGDDNLDPQFREILKNPAVMRGVR